jgi:hypothetical protein
MIRFVTLIILVLGALRSTACPVYPYLNNVTFHGAWAPVQKNMLLGIEWDKAGPGLVLYRSIAFNYQLNDPYRLKSLQGSFGSFLPYPITPVVLSPTIGIAHYSEESRNRTHFTYGMNFHLILQDNRKWVNGRLKLSYQRLAGAKPGINSRHLVTAGLGITLNAMKFTRYRNTTGRKMMGTGANF